MSLLGKLNILNHSSHHPICNLMLSRPIPWKENLCYEPSAAFSSRRADWQETSSARAERVLSTHNTRLAQVQRPRYSTLSCYYRRSRTATTVAVIECPVCADHRDASTDRPNSLPGSHILDSPSLSSSAQPGCPSAQSSGLRHPERPLVCAGY